MTRQFDIAVEAIQVVKVEDADWPDSCLGLGQEGEACAQEVKSGFRITLQAEGKNYIYRTDDTGSLVRLEHITE